MSRTIKGNRGAFLDMIAISEIGKDLLAVSDDGYNVLVGSTASHPILFKSYDDHPRILNLPLNSTAAGRYQLLARYYDDYADLLDLDDFTPASQDAIALQQIKERGALPHIDSGDIAAAIALCNNIWASLYGSPYHQHTNDLQSLTSAYTESGGTLGA